MKLRAILSNLLLSLVALAVGLFLSELAARVVLNPSDYLSVEMVPDRILGAVPSPNTIAGGYDDWGFRNEDVPHSAEIVAIGDSHTYGNTATMEDAWPNVLSQLTGATVYNLGMGGYGPNQYLHLLSTRAIQLKPRTVVIGLYIGDDFENAYLITYGLEYWAWLRTRDGPPVAYDIWEDPPTPSWHKRLRIWLSRNSIIYQLVFHGPLIGRFQGEAQINNASLISDEIVTIEDPAAGVMEAFRPRNMLRVLDQRDERIREGMRITFHLLEQMRDLCSERGIELVVAVIPTKEMVFADYLEHRPDLHLAGTLDLLLENERLARSATFSFLEGAGIRFVDTLPALRAARGHELYARTASDMHPNRNGYRVIAEAVSHELLRPAHPK